MSDLVIFVGLVALFVVLGIAVGIIVGGRIDRIIAPPRPVEPTADASQAQEDQ